MNQLTLQQRQNNAASRDHWEQAASHRQRVMQLIDSAHARPDARLCVLGAGNANDLDLARLAERFAEVHLVDLDDEALDAAIERQPVADQAALRRHGDCDLSGVWPQLEQLTPDRPASDDEVDALVAAASGFAGPTLPGPFDVVVSACVLSQLINAVVVSLGDTHLRFVDLLRAVRNRHLGLMIDLLVPGGTGIFITDVVSTDTAPQLQTVNPADLSKCVAGLIRDGNFFHGLNPKVLRAHFEQDEAIAPRVDDLEFIDPWLWHFGPRAYAVVAVKFRRA
ncbi:MAG: hypothetical protein R3C10_09870 [Pirellulales bacterium]